MCRVLLIWKIPRANGFRGASSWYHSVFPRTAYTPRRAHSLAPAGVGRGSSAPGGVSDLPWTPRASGGTVVTAKRRNAAPECQLPAGAAGGIRVPRARLTPRLAACAAGLVAGDVVVSGRLVGACGRPATRPAAGSALRRDSAVNAWSPAAATLPLAGGRLPAQASGSTRSGGFVAPLFSSFLQQLSSHCCQSHPNSSQMARSHGLP